MKRKRWLTILLMAATLVVLIGCKGSPAVTLTPIVTAPPPAAGPGGVEGAVVASGQVVPAQEAEASFPVSGRVERVAVARGDEVQPGEALITLETALLEANVRQAEAALAAAQAHLALLEATPRSEEIAAAEAQVEAAEGALAQASAQRDRPDVGAAEAEVAAAQAQVAAAMADRLAAEEVHDQAMTCVEVEWGGEQRTICPALGPIEEQTRHNAQAAAAAQAAAQAQLDALLAGGDAEARAVQSAVWTAAAQRDAAQAQLDMLRSGTTVEAVAAAESGVAQAEAALQAARAALDQATLRAPFAGTVAALEIHPGEAVMPGQAVLTLADLRHLRVETTDLSERDVVRVAVGQPTTVYIEPLDVEVGGQVVRIASQADALGGDVVYAVTVQLDEQPAGLRWGMSVEVEVGAE